jgi:hypothetical protein
MGDEFPTVRRHLRANVGFAAHQLTSAPAASSASCENTITVISFRTQKLRREHQMPLGDSKMTSRSGAAIAM